MSARGFEVVAPDARLVLALPALALLGGVAGVAIAGREDPRAWIALPILALVSAILVVVVRRRRVRIEQGVLVVEAAFHRARIPVASLDLAQARVVDLAEQSSLRPALKTFGTAMPGYKAGHFRLRDRGRAFVLVTDPARVLVLHEQTGRRVLLSLVHPQQLLAALREVATAGAPR